MLYLARWRLDPDSGPGDLIPDLGPDTEGLSFAVLDLRGQADRLASRVADDEVRGWCVAWTPDRIETKRNRIISLGDDPDDVSVAALRVMEARLGWNPERGKRPNRLGDLVFEFAADESDDADDAKPNRLGVNRQGRREIKIGPHLMGGEPVPSSVGAAYTDDFNRADGLIGSNWTRTGGTGSTFSVLSNQLRNDVDGQVTVYTYSAGAAAGDAQYCESKLETTGSFEYGPQVRMLDSLANASGYQAHWRGSNDNHGRIRYSDTAATPSRTTLTQAFGLTAVADLAVIRIEVDGTALTWWHDGTEITSLATTDSTYPASSTRRSGGQYLHSNTTRVDNWAFGDLGVAAQDIAPTAIASTAAVTAPSVVRSIYATQIVEPFTYADAALQAQADWNASSSYSIVSNEITINSNGARQATHATALAGSLVGVWAEIQVVALGTGAQKATNLAIRRIGSGTSTTIRSAYLRYRADTGNFEIRYRDSAEVEQGVASAAISAPSVPYMLRLEAIGEEYKGYINGVELVSGTIAETDLPHTYEFTGFHAFQSLNGIWDNYAAGIIIVSGFTATPIAPTAAVTAPTLAPGPVTITTTPIASTAAVSMPGVETAGGIVATPVGSSASVTTPAVVGGPVGFTADALASTAAVTGPSVAAGPVAVSATPIGGTASLTGPTVALGPANLTVTPIGSGVSVTTPVVAARVAITPTPLGSMVAFLALSIATGAAVGSADVTLGVYLDKGYGRVKTGPSPLSSHILNTTRRSAPPSER